jgi:hypothetical protein
VANPTWFGGKWLEVFDEIDLCALYEETRAHRPRVPSRHVLFGMILERLRPHFAEGKLL